MPLQPPIVLNMQAGTAYPILLKSGGAGQLVAVLRSGECWAAPLLSAPASLINTTATANIAAGTRTVTPAEMTNIAVGSLLAVDSGDSQETVIVTTLTATTFTAVFGKAHNGGSTAFPIVGSTFSPAIALPTSSPSPTAGTASYGWFHLATATEKRSVGVESVPVAGQVYFPGGTAERIYGVIVWCVGSGEIEFNGQ